MKELSLDVLQSQLRPNARPTVTEDTVAEIQKLAEDPDYGEEFLHTYIDHLNVFKEQKGRSHQQYLNAIKFYSLVQAGNNLTDAYIKVFPERYEDRTRGMPKSSDKDKAKAKAVMRGEASRYNGSVLVAEINKVAAIPVQIVHRHLLHEAILEQAKLMRTARSEMVRQKAGATLITELKPTEDQVLKVDVEDGAKSMIEELRQATEKLAAAEYQSVTAGVPLKKIAERDIIDVQVEEVDVSETTHIPADFPEKNLASETVEKSTSYEPPNSTKTPGDDLEDELADIPDIELGEEKPRWTI